MAVLDYIQYKKHLTMTGLESLVAIRASINLGLSDSLKKAFPLIIPIQRQLINGLVVPHGM